MRTHRKYDGKISSVSAGRWTAYAAAAAASTFAAAQSAEATIHYSGLVNSKIKGNGTGTFSLGSGGGFVYHSSFLDPHMVRRPEMAMSPFSSTLARRV